MSDHPPYFDDGPANTLYSAPTPSAWKRCFETCLAYFTAACAMLFGITFCLVAIYGVIAFCIEN